MPIAAGRLKQRVRFERRGGTSTDGFRSPGTGWEPIPGLEKVWAGFTSAALAARFDGGQIIGGMAGALQVRQNSKTRALKASDRVVFLNARFGGIAADIKSVTPSPDGESVELVIQTGGATG